MTQTSLGTVLATLGDRAGNTVRLAEGVAAYSQALEVYSNNNLTQNNNNNDEDTDWDTALATINSTMPNPGGGTVFRFTLRAASAELR